LHCAAVPLRTFIVQAFPSSHAGGQFPSHASPAATIPFPQLGVQSPALLALQPGAQHPSPAAHVAIAVNVHRTLHCPGVPVRTFLVHAYASSQVAGPVPSHGSLGASIVPFPQLAEQPSSFAVVQPSGQHPSPFAHAVTTGWAHSASQSNGLPE
jgi:hypothetical protein